MTPESFEERVHRKAIAHLEACDNAFFDEESDERPWFAPYDGCQDCIVREVLMVTWEEMTEEARRELTGEGSDWFVPGGAFITDEHKIRLRPPTSWHRAVLDVTRVPPSMNTNEIRSHWTGFQRHKKSWEEEIATLLMVTGVKRDRYQRAIAGAFIRSPVKAARRDAGNFESVLNKALGDALVTYGAIPDDDARHYFFGGVEFEDEIGPERTLIFVYLQPTEGA